MQVFALNVVWEGMVDSDIATDAKRVSAVSMSSGADAISALRAQKEDPGTQCELSPTKGMNEPERLAAFHGFNHRLHLSRAACRQRCFYEDFFPAGVLTA